MEDDEQEFWDILKTPNVNDWPIEGEIHYDMDSHGFYIFNGNSWIQLAEERAFELMDKS